MVVVFYKKNIFSFNLVIFFTTKSHCQLMFNIFLQPENILLDDNLNVKVSDFGFATVLGPEEELTGKSPICYK